MVDSHLPRLDLLPPTRDLVVFEFAFRALAFVARLMAIAYPSIIIVVVIIRIGFFASSSALCGRLFSVLV